MITHNNQPTTTSTNSSLFIGYSNVSDKNCHRVISNRVDSYWYHRYESCSHGWLLQIRTLINRWLSVILLTIGCSMTFITRNLDKPLHSYYLIWEFHGTSELCRTCIKLWAIKTFWWILTFMLSGVILPVMSFRRLRRLFCPCVFAWIILRK